MTHITKEDAEHMLHQLIPFPDETKDSIDLSDNAKLVLEILKLPYRVCSTKQLSRIEAELKNRGIEIDFNGVNVVRSYAKRLFH